ncbi:MAG: MBL fold metallo-hydrolase, partial [Verrucomicrobiaceae bacterium]
TEIGANSYSLEIAGKRLVLDSGMHPRYDGDAALPLLNLLPDDSVDAVLLSHAHQDHLGSLPVLMRRQPRAPVFMTEATRQLSDVMLHNSVNVMGKRRDEGLGAPLFSHREVDFAARRWATVPIQQRFSLKGERLRPDEDSEVSIEFFDAGHILGSVGTMVRAEGRSVFYTGDVNFENQTIMRAARFPEEPLDVLIIETTRGDSPTPEEFTRAAEEKRFGEALQAAFARGGSAMVPLFALGKTQEILAMIYQFRREGVIPETPVYIGGLSTKLTEIYDALAHHTPRQKHDLQLLESVNPFVLAGQEALTAQLRPGRIYALSSGTMTEKTLSSSFARQVLSDPTQSLYFVGYADPESPAG